MLILLCTLLLSQWNAFSQEAEDPLDVQLGEKLFVEDRFSHSFFINHNGKKNSRLTIGDPILDLFEMPSGTLGHPQKGKQVSCSSCHFVDQVSEIKENLVFAYNDFSIKPKVPFRDDFVHRATRNSSNMVLSSIQENAPLHWDGEFYSAKDLSCASLVGRNMGWKNKEAKYARKHIVSILRYDDGSYPLESELTESYQQSFAQLGYSFHKMSDEEVFMSACEMISRYMKSLDFSKDDSGEYIGSAYDQFLQKNNIRRRAYKNESDREYLQYLRDQFQFKQDWLWVEEQKLNFHEHPLRFGKNELEGMKIFFGKAQCATCHTPPTFTNRGFHGTGVSQLEYEAIHGKDQFKKLQIPSAADRLIKQGQYFIATEAHPEWLGPFKNEVSKTNVDWIDLGVWNVLGHPDKSKIQGQLKNTLCVSQRRKSCDWDDETFLNYAKAAFKTPTLRSLGQTRPYFHNGQAANLLDTLSVYKEASERAKKGEILNADPLLKIMRIQEKDFEFLISFLESLDEDYN